MIIEIVLKYSGSHNSFYILYYFLFYSLIKAQVRMISDNVALWIKYDINFINI